MLAPPQARPFGARRGGDPAGAVNVDSNASRAREVERKCERARFLLDCAHAPQARPRSFDPSKPTIVQAKSIVSLVPITDSRHLSRDYPSAVVIVVGVGLV